MQKQTTGIQYIFSGTLLQVVASIAGTISAINDGMHYAWSAPVIPILNSEDSPIKIFITDEKWLETIYMIGGIGGIPLTMYLVNKIGRKNSTIVSTCFSLLSWILIALAPNIAYVYVARFLSGLAADTAFVATPMYVAEIADRKVRGFLSSLIHVMMLFGTLLMYLVAPFTSFYVPSIIGSSILIIQLVSFPFMPKSPYYLLSKRKEEAARKALNRLRTTKDNEVEFQEIKKAIERQIQEKWRPQDLFLVKSNRRAIVIMTVLSFAQQFCGISVMLMNIHTILKEADSVYLSSNTAAILFSTFMFMASICCSFLVDKYGRKFLLTTSSILTGISLLILAIYFNMKSIGYDVRSLSWIPVLSVMVYAAVYELGLGVVPKVVSAELFSNKVKTMGMTISDAMFLIFGLLSIELGKVLSVVYGYHAEFYLFSGLSFVTAVFTVVIIPETKGKTLEEIQILLKGKKVVRVKEKFVTVTDTNV